MKANRTTDGIVLTPESFWDKLTLERLNADGIDSITLDGDLTITIKNG